MSMVLSILGWSVFGLAILAGLALDLVGLFGNWVILAAVGGAWALTGFEHFGGWTLLGLAALAALGEALEMASAGYGAAKFGGGKGTVAAAIAGCLLGAVAGTPWLPVIGTLAGACLGAFIGAASYEYLSLQRQAHTALWTGLGAALGKVAGIFAKVFVGIVMLCVAALAF